MRQPTRHKLEVGYPIVENPNKKPGDIDVLIWEQKCPHEAIALECKRVKVIVDDSGRDKANKVNAIGDGVVQANAVLNLGFHRTEPDKWGQVLQSNICPSPL